MNFFSHSHLSFTRRRIKMNPYSETSSPEISTSTVSGGCDLGSVEISRISAPFTIGGVNSKSIPANASSNRASHSGSSARIRKAGSCGSFPRE